MCWKRSSAVSNSIAYLSRRSTRTPKELFHTPLKKHLPRDRSQRNASSSFDVRANKTFQIRIDLVSHLCYLLGRRPPVIKSKRIAAKRSVRKHALSASEKPSIPKKTTSVLRRKMVQGRAKEEVPRDKSAVPRLRSQSESSGQISSGESSAKRCVRVMHVIGTCSVCRGFCDVVHLLGDKRARCGQCCPVCATRTEKAGG
jgi:hypothetical protein